MGNFNLNGRTIAIIALVVIAAVVFLPQLLGGNNGGGLFGGGTPATPTPVNEPVNPRDTTVNTEDGIELGRPVMASGVDRDGCATQMTSTFPAGTDIVYVVAPGSDVAQGTEVFVRWYRDGQTLEDAPEIVADQDYRDTCINFTLEPDDANGLRAGRYEAEFIVNGNPADTVSFEIR